jgi:hypothetical protein
MDHSEHHLANIGRIVVALARHEPGDCRLNDPIVTDINNGATAREIFLTLARMSASRANGIIEQLGPIGPFRNFPADSTPK